MAAPSESSLISKLQSSDSSGIHALVSDYLRPLADLKATKKSKPEPTLICSLAKRFLSFLNASRGFPSPTTPFCYSNCSAFTGSASIAWTPSLLSWLPSHSPSNSRDFASCTVSKFLRGFDSRKRKGKLLHEIDKGGGGSKDLCSLIVDIAVSLVRCASAGLAKEDGDFKKVLQLVEEVTPWLKLTIGFYFSSSPRSSNSTKKHEFHYNCCIDTGDQRLVVFSTDNPDFVCWDMGNSPGAFPVIQVWTVSLPVTLVNASDKNPFLHVVDVIGWILVSGVDRFKRPFAHLEEHYGNSERSTPLHCRDNMSPYLEREFVLPRMKVNN
ncbi:uncharacterized protein LOC114170430 [Vigna unguiculata]|uniref:uncharacterized protein LOC114170430 n=1 Tax=Vigna unguiculata TaxID=3917 RepID=UPI00101704CB|nr:uncharacterized protein LOC114170430 [Vigna unguiculata]